MRTAGVVLLLCLLHGAQHADADPPRWTPDAFPNPMIDKSVCGREGIPSRICDPDNLLSRDSANVVEGIIQDIESAKQPYHKSPCDQPGNQGYQVCTTTPVPPSTHPSDAIAEDESPELEQELLLFLALFGIHSGSVQLCVLGRSSRMHNDTDTPCPSSYTDVASALGRQSRKTAKQSLVYVQVYSEVVIPALQLFLG